MTLTRLIASTAVGLRTEPWLSGELIPFRATPAGADVVMATERARRRRRVIVYGVWPVMPLTAQLEPLLVRVKSRELLPLHWVLPAPGVALNL